MRAVHTTHIKSVHFRHSPGTMLATCLSPARPSGEAEDACVPRPATADNLSLMTLHVSRLKPEGSRPVAVWQR